jgi:CubicO group peptidase (beta-lactamase class C family)
MKKNLFKRILYVFLLIVVIANVAIWASDTTYIYKALVYQQPGIDDLEIFPYNTIENKGPKDPWKISATKNAVKLSDTLRQVLEKYESVAFLVIKNDSIQYEEYWDGYNENSSSNSFSMAKSIVSILIGIAIDEGIIESENDAVGKYVPEYNVGDLKKVKIIDVLKMASGLSFKESYSTPFNQTTDAYYGKDLRKLIYSLKVETEPGTEFYYRSGDTQLLEFVLKAATGKSISEYASEKLWSKIGADNPAYWSVDKEGGDEKAYCCFYSNARDFARIGKLYLQNGKWDSSQIVSSEWVKKSVSPHGLPENGVKTNQYGLQWWIYNDIFYCRGILGQYIIVDPTNNMIVVRLGHKRDDNKDNNHPKDFLTYVRETRRLF